MPFRVNPEFKIGEDTVEREKRRSVERCSTPHRHLMQETARVKVSRRNFFYVMNLLGKKFYWRLVITSWSLANALARISTNDQ